MVWLTVLKKYLPNKIFDYASKFRENLIQESEINIAHHIDGDGMSAGALLGEVLEKYGISFEFYPTWFAQIEKYLPEGNAAILDIPFSFIRKHLKKFNHYYIIDHHPDYKEISLANYVFNPHLLNINEIDPSYLNTGLLVYILFPEELENSFWKVAVSLYTDRSTRTELGKKLYEMAEKKYGELFTIIKIVDLFSYKEDVKKQKELVEVYKEAKGPKEFLEMVPEDIKAFSFEIDELIKEITENWEAYVLLEEGNIKLLKIDVKYNIQGPIATLLGEKYPNIVWIVISKSRVGYRGSVRFISAEKFGINLGQVLEEAAKGFGRGGGHVTAGGVTVRGNLKNVEEFFKKFVKTLKEKQSPLTDFL